MKVLAFTTAATVVLVVVSGCSAPAPQPTASQTQPIQGGSVDTTHSYAVGVVATVGLVCSGALIAPNLVLTARHCVNQPSSQTIDCATTTFGSQYTSTGNFYVTTNYQISGNTGVHQAKQIITTPGNKMCGNDMALIILQNNVSLNEAGGSYVTPVVQGSISDHTKYSTTITAIGYGDTSATTQDAGTRHILQNINLACIPGDSVIDCPSNIMSQMTTSEFQSGDGTCEGDSGSSAYEQKNFNKNVPVSFGVLSRGGSQNSTCLGGVYTRTDSWSSLIIQTAMTAASIGGYTPPAWTQASPPPSDGGTTQDSGTTSDGAAPPPPGTLGAPCADATDCDSGLCLSNDNGTTYICSAPCDPTGDGSDCGQSGYMCQGDGTGAGYCFPAPPSTTSSSSGGCAVSKSDPSKPVPWGTLAFAGAFVGVALARSRRRR